MKVDGLTNDEVKSHLQVTPSPLWMNFWWLVFQPLEECCLGRYLQNMSLSWIHILQKYRLHTRRQSTSSQSVSLEAPQMVGMWVPLQCAVAQAAAQPTSGVYDPSPPSYCQPSHPQDYFTCNMSTGSSGGQLKQHPTTFEPQKSALLSQSSPQVSTYCE